MKCYEDCYKEFFLCIKLMESSNMYVLNYQVSSVQSFMNFLHLGQVTHTPQGMETLRHFLFDVCGVSAEWKMEDVLE